MKITGINRQLFFNVLSSILLKGISFFTIPIYTRLLSTSDYGNYNIFITWVTLILPIMSLETDANLGTAKYEFGDDYSSYKTSNILLGTLSFALFLILILFFREKFATLLGFSKTVIILMIVYAFATYVINYVTAIYRYEKKAEYNMTITFLLSILSAILSIIFIKNVVWQDQYLNRIYGEIIIYVIFAIILYVGLFIKNEKKFNFKYWKFSLKFSLPLIFHILSNDLLSQSNKLMLDYLGFSGATVGVYAFFQSFTSIVLTIIYALNNSWVPFYYEFLNNKDYNSLKIKNKNYIELMAIVIAGFLLLSREVCVLFASSDYLIGINIIPFLVVSNMLIFMYQFPVNNEYYNKKTNIIFIGTVISSVLNIVLNYLFIPKYGMYGSAISSIVSYFVLFIIHFLFARNFKNNNFKMTFYDYLPILIIVLISIAMFYLLPNAWLVRWLIGFILGVFELIRIIKRKSIF